MMSHFTITGGIMNKITLLKLAYFLVMAWLIFNTEGRAENLVLSINLLVMISLLMYQLRCMRKGRHVIEVDMDGGK